MLRGRGGGQLPIARSGAHRNAIATHCRQTLDLGPRQIFWVSAQPPTMPSPGARGDGERSHGAKLDNSINVLYIARMIVAPRLLGLTGWQLSEYRAEGSPSSLFNPRERESFSAEERKAPAPDDGSSAGASARAIELAPNAGPRRLGNSGFIRGSAGRGCRAADEARSAFATEGAMRTNVVIVSTPSLAFSPSFVEA